MADAPEAFDPNYPGGGYSDPLEEPGVAKFAKLICGRDVVYQVMEDNDHWGHDDHHWEDDDHHRDDDDHHWENDDHDRNQNFQFFGADLGCKPSKRRKY